MYIDKFGFIHKNNIPKIDYMKELDRLYKKAFPNEDNKPKPKPINEVRALHKVITEK